MGIRTKMSISGPRCSKGRQRLSDGRVCLFCGHLSAGWQGSLNGVVQLIKNNVRTLAWSTNPHRGRGES